MPCYEYQCESCGKEFSLMQSAANDAEAAVCPACGGRKTKKKPSLFSASGSDDSG